MTSSTGRDETLVVVAASGQHVTIHWQRPDCQPTVTEHLSGPTTELRQQIDHLRTYVQQTDQLVEKWRKEGTEFQRGLGDNMRTYLLERCADELSSLRPK